MQTTFAQPKASDHVNKSDFVLALKEEDFKMKDFEEPDVSRQSVPKLPDFDMKMLPTFKDLPPQSLGQVHGHITQSIIGQEDSDMEDRKQDELANAHSAQQEFCLGGQNWRYADWWRQMDHSDEQLMYELGLRALEAPQQMLRATTQVTAGQRRPDVRQFANFSYF